MTLYSDIWPDMTYGYHIAFILSLPNNEQVRNKLMI